MVESICPAAGCELQGVAALPRSLVVHELGLVQADDRLGQCVVVRVRDRADRELDARVIEPLAVANGQVLRPLAL